MINKKEVERYLGYGKNNPDERTTELIEECIRQIEKIAQPRSIYRIFDLKLKEDQIEAAGMKMQSRNLAKNLRGCEKIVFFAATLGNEPDILMNRYSRQSGQRRSRTIVTNARKKSKNRQRQKVFM